MVKRNKEMDIKPISLWESVLLFGIPGLALYLGLYYGIPIFHRMGLPEIFLFPFFLWVPLISLLPVSLILFKREKRLQADLNLKRRFRLKKLTKKDWLWVIGGIIFVAIFDFVLMEPISIWMAAISFLLL